MASWWPSSVVNSSTKTSLTNRTKSRQHNQSLSPAQNKSTPNRRKQQHFADIVFEAQGCMHPKSAAPYATSSDTPPPPPNINRKQDASIPPAADYDLNRKLSPWIEHQCEIVLQVGNSKQLIPVGTINVTHNMTVGKLRNSLTQKNVLNGNPFTFVVNGVPLNPVQERHCLVDLFRESGKQYRAIVSVISTSSSKTMVNQPTYGNNESFPRKPDWLSEFHNQVAASCKKTNEGVVDINKLISISKAEELDVSLLKRSDSYRTPPKVSDEQLYVGSKVFHLESKRRGVLVRFAKPDTFSDVQECVVHYDCEISLKDALLYLNPNYDAFISRSVFSAALAFLGLVLSNRMLAQIEQRYSRLPSRHSSISVSEINWRKCLLEYDPDAFHAGTKSLEQLWKTLYRTSYCGVESAETLAKLLGSPQQHVTPKDFSVAFSKLDDELLTRESVWDMFTTLDSKLQGVVSFTSIQCSYELFEDGKRWRSISVLQDMLQHALRGCVENANHDKTWRSVIATARLHNVGKIEGAGRNLDIESLNWEEFQRILAYLFEDKVPYHSVESKMLFAFLANDSSCNGAIAMDTLGSLVEMSNRTRQQKHKRVCRLLRETLLAEWNSGSNFKQLFASIDPTLSGEISQSDFAKTLEKVCKAHNIFLTSEDIKLVVDQFETNNGSVRYRGLLKFLVPDSSLATLESTRKRIRSKVRLSSFGGIGLHSVFRDMVSCSSNEVPTSELFHCLESVQCLDTGALTDQEKQQLIDDIDANGDGKVSFSEFSRFILAATVDIAPTVQDDVNVQAQEKHVVHPRTSYSCTSKAQDRQVPIQGRQGLIPRRNQRQVNSYLDTAKFY